MPVIGSIGVKQDLLIKQGATFPRVLIRLRNADGSYVLLSSGTFLARIKKTGLSSTVTASFTFTSVNSTTSSMEMLATLTQSIQCGETLASPASKYVWDCEFIVTATSRVIPLLYGDVLVYRDV